MFFFSSFIRLIARQLLLHQKCAIVLTWMGCACVVYFTMWLPAVRNTDDENESTQGSLYEKDILKPEPLPEPITAVDLGPMDDALPVQSTSIPDQQIVNEILDEVLEGDESWVWHLLNRVINVKNGVVGITSTATLPETRTAPPSQLERNSGDTDKTYPLKGSPLRKKDERFVIIEGIPAKGKIPDNGTLCHGACVEQTAIDKYFKTEQEKCSKQDEKYGINVQDVANNPNISYDVMEQLTYCPCIPPNLKGRLTPLDLSSNFSLNDIRERQHTDVLPGGEWQPVDCRARTRLAVIIPYRDRMHHLKIFLNHMLPILKRQLAHFRIFVVEQNEPAVFNKAAMMNIGYLEAVKTSQFDCVMFHDVDIVMEDDRSLLNCGDKPHHYAVSLDRWNYRLKYERIFGGVVAMSPEMFNRTNGFSNSFFGWGGEDDDMGYRVRRVWKTWFRPPTEIARYTTIKHDREPANAVNKERMQIMRKQAHRYKRDGINSIQYTIKERQQKPLFTWILADLNVSGLPYPKHPTFNYSLADDDRVTCSHDDGMTSPKDLSRVTCQYDCDRLDGDCLGYSHRDLDDETKECRLLRGNCSGLVVALQTASSLSYLKLPLTLHFL